MATEAKDDALNSFVWCEFSTLGLQIRENLDDVCIREAKVFTTSME